MLAASDLDVAEGLPVGVTEEEALGNEAEVTCTDELELLCGGTVEEVKDVAGVELEELTIEGVTMFAETVPVPMGGKTGTESDEDWPAGVAAAIEVAGRVAAGRCVGVMTTVGMSDEVLGSAWTTAGSLLRALTTAGRRFKWRRARTRSMVDRLWNDMVRKRMQGVASSFCV